MKRRVARILATIMMAATFANAFSHSLATADDYVYVEDEVTEAPAEVQEAAEAPVQEEAPAPVTETPAAPAEEIPAPPAEEIPAEDVPSIEETAPVEGEVLPAEAEVVLPEEAEISTEEVNEAEERTLTAYAGQTKITVSFMSDAFDGMVALEADEITVYDNAYEQVEAAVEEAAAQNEDLSTEDFAAFDIRFIDEYGYEVEPAEGAQVAVSISTTGKETPAPEKVAEVIHITNENQVEFMDADTSGKTADFTTESFSIYIVVGGNTRESRDGYTANAQLYRKGAGGTARPIRGTNYVQFATADVTFTAGNGNGASYQVKGYDQIHGVYFHSGNNVFHKVSRFRIADGTTDNWRVYAQFDDGTEDVTYFDNRTGVSNVGHFAWLTEPLNANVISAKVYLKYDNFVPDNSEGNQLHGPIKVANFGPFGNNEPYFNVSIDLVQLEELGGKAVRNSSGYTYYSYLSSGLGDTAGNSALAQKFFYDYIMKAMPNVSAEEAKLGDRFGYRRNGQLNYVGYVLKLEDDGWHLDGMAVDAPSFLIELYDLANYGNKPFGTIPSLERRPYSQAKDKFEDYFRNHFKDVTSIVWTDANERYEGEITLGDGTVYSFKITTKDQYSGVDNNGIVTYNPITPGIFNLARFFVDFQKVATGSLKITKVLEGDLNDTIKNTEFTFRVLDASGKALRFTKTGDTAYQRAGQEGVENIRIKGAGSVTVTGLRAGEYTVVENNPSAPLNYTVTTTPANGTAVRVVANNQREAKITNKYTADKIKVDVEKRWNDEENADGLRPVSVTVNLLANNAATGKSVTLNAGNNWKGSFTGLDKVDASGKDISYTVQEISVENYSSVVTGSMGAGFVITNKHDVTRISIPVKKVWNDEGNAAGLRPTNVRVQLLHRLNDGLGWRVAEGKEITLSASSSWQGSFDDLPMYANKKPIGYRVQEVKPQGDPYTTTYTPDVSQHNIEILATDADAVSTGVTITNTYAPKKINIPVEKKWDDNNNQDGVRPTKVIVRLLNHGVDTGKSIELESDAKGIWRGSFENQPEYVNGKLANYTVQEEPVEGYQYKVESDGKGGFIITNTHKPGYTSVRVIKVWKDSDDAEGFRGTVTVYLKADGQRVKDANGNEISVELTKDKLTDVFENLPEMANGKKIEYTVEEKMSDEVEPYYQGKITGSAQYGYVIENEHITTPVTIDVKKIWEDNNNSAGFRPQGIKVELYANGTLVNDAVLGGTGKEWTYTFRTDSAGRQLLKFANGKKIEYTVKEVTDERTKELYDLGEPKMTETDNGYAFEMENRYQPETIVIKVTKTWEDEKDKDGYRPTDGAVTVRLYADGEEVKVATLKENDDPALTATWEGLPKHANGKEIVYTLREDPVPRYTATIVPAQIIAEDGTFAVTNSYKPQETHVEVQKKWDDQDDREGFRRPVTVILTNNANLPTQEAVLTADTDYFHDFTGLQKVAGGEEVEYSIEEVQVEGYGKAKVEKSGLSDGGYRFDLENPRIVTPISIKVTKKWDDAKDADGFRPDSITVRLMADKHDPQNSGFVQVASRQLTGQGDEWSYTFNNLQAYANGQKITYRVDEVKVNRYTTTILPESTDSIDYNQSTGFVITNSYTPVPIEIAVEKVWDDNENAAGMRPDGGKVTIELWGNDQYVDEYEFSDGDLKHTFKDLPKYEDGALIKYEVKENQVKGYQAPAIKYATVEEADGAVVTGAVVTNTYKPGETTVKVTKKWEDTNNKEGLRPKSIKVELRNNSPVGTDGEQLFKTIPRTLDADQNWTYTFTGLPTVRGGQEITYTVEEVDVPKADEDGDGIIDNDKGYTVKYDGQGTAEVVITNSREVKEFDIPVWKEWNDADANGVENADGRRPKSIRVNLVREDKPDEIVDTVELKDSTDPKWYNEFKNVQAYENGEEIIYNVVEVRETGNILLYTVDYKRVDENDISKGVTIINTYEPKPVRVAVEKKWEDEGLELERPDSVTVHLLANGGEAFYSDGTTKVEALVLSEANGWKGVFENLPAAKNDRAISYTVKEERVVNYKTEIRERRVDIEENGETVSVEGFVITNTRTPDEETVKTVNGKKEVELTNRNADINYSISTKIPVRDGLETELDSFRIEDELNPVLEYKNGNGGVIVKVDGHALNNNEVVHDDVTVVRFEGQKLIVTIPQRFLTEEHQGVTPVQVDFIAKIRPEITSEQLAAYVTTEGTEDGSFTIPNKATAIIDVPNGYKEIPSEIVRLTPPEYDITKKVDGGTHKTLDDRTAPFTYTIETTVAEKKGLTKFVITDELEKDVNGLPVVVFADTNVDVSLPGADVNVDEKNGILTVTYEGDMTRYMGKPVKITFTAKLNEDPAVDFSKYEAGEDGPLVPNTASYTSYINGVPEDPEPSDPVTVTPPDPEIDKMIEQPDGSLEDNLTLPERYASIPYVITTKMPVRSNMTKFVVTDALEPVLQVKDGETVSVLLGGEEVGQATANVPVPEEGKSQVITVTFDKDNGFTEQKTVNGETIDVIKAAHQGKDIVVRFNATVRPGVNLANYIEGETVIIKNYAKYNISIPTGDLPDEWSEETRVTPPESTIEKTVDGGLHKDLTNRDDPFTYEIVTAIPEKDGVTSFVIEDTLASVLTFDGRVSVTVDGKQENSAANTNGQLLRVTIPGRYLSRDEYKNAPVVIRFNAKIKDDATVDDLKEFLVDADGNPTGTAKIPNTAKYIINNNEPKESNEVTVTPPEPEIDKEANGQKDPQLVGRYEEIVYTINTELPIRNDLESFVITDQLADALTFADDPEVKVTPEGAAISTDNDTLTVTFTGDALNNNIGQKVQVTFKAKIKEDLSGIDMTQYTKNGPAEIPNQATYHYEFPDKPATKPVPSNEIIITPKDPEITKIVDGPDPQHKILSDRFENAHYTLTTELPIRDDMNRFVIEDIIEPELQFVGTNGGAIVKIGGNDVTTQVTVKTEGTDTLQVIIGDKALLRDNMGKAVTVEFDARIRDNAQLADHISAKYERGDAATASGKVEVPNIGRYFIYLNGNNNGPRRLSPASAQTQADASKESNTVYITPPDPTPEKTVNGGTHLDLVRPDQAIPYRVTSRVPERQDLEYFVLTDTIEDVLQFVDGSVSATLGGQNVTNLVRISGQKLTLRLDGQYVAKQYQGQPVVISFSAQFKKGADLSKYVTVNYAVPNEATQEFKTPDDNPKEKSDVVTTTPPPEIEKEVKGAPQATIENRREEIPYTINTSIPLHDGVTSFVVTDVVEPVLDIVNGSVKVTVDGQEVTGAASVQGQTLTVNITDAALLAQKNAKVQISFTAKIREGADLSAYRVNNTDTAEIPNKASYRYAFDGKVFEDTTEEVIVRLDPEMISIPVEKIWEDDNNRDNVRPQSITVRVTSDAPGFTARTLTLAQANSWKGTFTDLPRYRITGEKITYTVTEDAVANYTTAVTTTEDTLGSVNGATITNTHTPGRTDVSVVKVWAGDAGVARPASITIRLQANGRATGQTLTLSAANGWSGSFTNLYINENGRAITYTVTEDAVANYTTTITANGTYAYTVTNTYNTPPVPPEDPPANPPEEPEVLGATRVRTTDTPEVLGARRGKTGDEFDPMQHMMYLLFAASACVLFALSDGKKKEEEQ